MPFRAYTNFGGGVDTSNLGPVIVDNGLTEAFQFWDDAQNFQLQPNGILKFPGFTSVLTSALGTGVTITGLFEFNYNGALHQIVCAGGSVYRVNGAGLTSLYSGATAGQFYQACNWGTGGQSVLILMNGVDKPLVYNGVTCVVATYIDTQGIWSDFRPQGAGVFRGRIFYWGDANKPWHLLTPQPGTYNNFDDSQNTCDGFDIDPGYGGKITGFKALTDNTAIIYKEKCFRKLFGVNPFNVGPEPFTITFGSDEVGCIAPRTLLQVGIDHFFLGSNGLKQLSTVLNYGSVEASDPSYPIQDPFSTLNYTQTCIVNACAVYDQPNNRIVLAVPDGGAAINTLIYNYNVVTKANEPRGYGITAGSLGVFNRKVYHGDYGGQIYQHGNANGYNGSAFNAYAKSKIIAHGGIGLLKRYKEIHLYAEGVGATDIIVQWGIYRRGQLTTNQQTVSIPGGANTWDVGQWDQAVWATGNTNEFKIKNPGRGNGIQLQIINNSGSQLPKIREIDMNYDIFGTSRG